MNRIDTLKRCPAGLFCQSVQAQPMTGMYPFWPYAAGQSVPGTLPFVAGYPDVFLEERQSYEDARRLQSFYPAVAREIQRQVEEECDKMEYEGSMMFDEYPDRMMMKKLAEDISDKVKAMHPEELEDAAFAEKPDSENPLLMQAEGRRRPPRRRDDWLGDLVQVILVDEMHRRRCRHRRCRNNRFW